MDETTQTSLSNLRSGDRELQNKAFLYVLEATDKPVEESKYALLLEGAKATTLNDDECAHRSDKRDAGPDLPF